MKKQMICECGSKKFKDDCCSPQKRVWMKPFLQQNEHKEFLEKVKISSQFDLRYRGLLEFYGDDLIEYKQLKPTSKSRNEFLTVLGKYLTEYLEDDCPSSWKDCSPSFWEEFLFCFYPFLMKITPKEKEVDLFLSELKKFTYWVDRKFGSSSYGFIEKYIQESSDELKECEHLLNRVYLHTFPFLHHKDWNPQLDILQDTSDNFHEVNLNIFEVTNLNDSIVVGTTIDSNLTYYIKGMPYNHIVPGHIISGAIGRKNSEWIWTWHHPESVFPQRAKKFLSNVKLGV